MTEKELPTQAYPGDGILEEEQTIAERTAPPRRSLDEYAVQSPISVLPYVPPLCVARHTSVAEAIRLMQEEHVGCVVVVEADRLVGIFTERDVLNKVVGGNRDLTTLEVEAVMTADPEALPVDAAIAFALNLMGEGGFRHLPLVDDAHRPVGMLSVKHIVHYLIDHFPADIRNLPPRPELLHPGQREGA